MKPLWHYVVSSALRTVLTLNFGASAPLRDQGWMSGVRAGVVHVAPMQASHLTFPGPGFTVTISAW